MGCAVNDQLRTDDGVAYNFERPIEGVLAKLAHMDRHHHLLLHILPGPPSSLYLSVSITLFLYRQDKSRLSVHAFVVHLNPGQKIMGGLGLSCIPTPTKSLESKLQSTNVVSRSSLARTHFQSCPVPVTERAQSLYSQFIVIMVQCLYGVCYNLCRARQDPSRPIY